MSMISFHIKKLWNEFCKRTKHATVFLDSNIAECLHWSGGITRLISCGTSEIKEFSPFEQVSQQKAVFVVSTPLFGSTADTIRDIIQNSLCQYVVAITTINMATHIFQKTGSLDGDAGDVVTQFEEKLLEWMGNMSFTAEVLHIPLAIAEITTDFFIMPPFSDLQSLHDFHLSDIQKDAKTAKKDKVSITSLSDLTPYNLPMSLRLFNKCFTSSIHDLLDELEVREDIYSLGPTARLLAEDLENFPPAKSRRKGCEKQVSLIFIDRSLDMATPTSHSYDCILDRIIQTLPRFPGHKNDIMIDMTCLSDGYNVSNETFPAGCLADIQDKTIINSLLTGKQKEVVMQFERQLVEAALTNKLPVKVSTKSNRGSYEQLANTATLFRQNNDAVSTNLNILQASLALSQSLNHSSNSRHGIHKSTEKLLLQSLTDDKQSILAKITELFVKEMEKSAASRSYTVDDFLTLLIHVYSTIGHSQYHDTTEESTLMGEMVAVILREADNLPPITKQLVGTMLDKPHVSLVVQGIWTKLRSVSQARQHLKQFGDLLAPSTETTLSTCVPIVKQVVQAILDPARPDLPGLSYHSGALRDFLKSGFGLFKSVAKPRPDNNPVCILFVIGGITLSEVKAVHEVIATNKPQTQIIIGSTQILKSSDITEKFLCHNALSPKIGVDL